MRLLIGLVDAVFNIYYLMLIARVILSWLPHPPASRAVEVLHAFTDPLLSAVRRVIPPTSMGMDFSSVVAILLLWFAQSIVTNLLGTLAWGI